MTFIEKSYCQQLSSARLILNFTWGKQYALQKKTLNFQFTLQLFAKMNRTFFVQSQRKATLDPLNI